MIWRIITNLVSSLYYCCDLFLIDLSSNFKKSRKILFSNKSMITEITPVIIDFIIDQKGTKKKLRSYCTLILSFLFRMEYNQDMFQNDISKTLSLNNIFPRGPCISRVRSIRYHHFYHVGNLFFDPNLIDRNIFPENPDVIKI